LTVAGFPSPTTAGVAGSFTVTLRDSYGNIASGYTGTVHFTSSDHKASLPANYSFTAADAGVHTFSATLKTAGTQSITVTDTTRSTLTGRDAGITVNPAAASKFIIIAPSSVTAGTLFSLTVKVEDAYVETMRAQPRSPLTSCLALQSSLVPRFRLPQCSPEGLEGSMKKAHH
jgi:hypothetical protein